MHNAPFVLERLQTSHDRSGFQSGSAPLDSYFKQQVTQDMRRRITACYVAVDSEQRIAGFYTLAATALLLTQLPEPLRKKLPRYPTVGAVRLGRLAVDLRVKGVGLGAALLADAIERSMRSEIAAYALVVDAKDDSAAAFYRHHGLIAMPSQPLLLFLPLASVLQDRTLVKPQTQPGTKLH